MAETLTEAANDGIVSGGKELQIHDQMQAIRANLMSLKISVMHKAEYGVSGSQLASNVDIDRIFELLYSLSRSKPGETYNERLRTVVNDWIDENEPKVFNDNEAV